jgi:hypothetical protein
MRGFEETKGDGGFSNAIILLDDGARPTLNQITDNELDEADSRTHGKSQPWPQAIVAVLFDNKEGD